MFPLLWPLIKSLKVKATLKGKYVTWYIYQVGALSKAEDILEWNMGLVLATARILFQRNISRCVKSQVDQSLFLNTYEIDKENRQYRKGLCKNGH